jgi:hypothetical protein
LYLCFENQNYADVAAKNKEFVLLVHLSSLISASSNNSPESNFYLIGLLRRSTGKRELFLISSSRLFGLLLLDGWTAWNSLMRILVKRHRWMHISQWYSRIGALSLHILITMHRNLSKSLQGRKLLIQETTTMRRILIWMMNVVIHKKRNKTSKKGLYEGARKGQK